MTSSPASSRTEVRQVCSEPELREAYDLLQRELELGENHHRALDYYLERLDQSPELMIVALSEGRVIGALFGSTQGDHVLIGEVAVASAWRGRGIGSRMLAELEANARRLGQHRLLLGSLEDATGFYLGRGFEPLLFLFVAGEDHGRRLTRVLDLLLAGREVLWRQDGEADSRAIVSLDGLDEELRVRVEAELGEGSAGYLFRKDI